MRQIIFIIISIILFTVTGCTEDVDIQIPENFEKAEITGVSVYNEKLAGIGAKVTINNEAASVNIVLNSKQDLTRLKVTLTISSGATITKPLGTTVQDYSSPKKVTIQSPGGSIEKEWLIELVNP